MTLLDHEVSGSVSQPANKSYCVAIMNVFVDVDLSASYLVSTPVTVRGARIACW